MQLLLSLSQALPYLTLLFVPTVAAQATVDLGYAKYTGVVDGSTNIARFLGIRYAAPPTGNLRWRRPQAPEPIPGIQMANNQPPPCYNAPPGSSPGSPFRNGTFQIGLASPSGFVGESEDCLFLNVFTPAIEPEQPLPVLVWIHGGGYVGGMAANYDGTHLIQESGSRIVFVAIQYRLGAFGFLAGKAMKQDGDLNVGLLDQHFALRWVNANIRKFGGDPDRVTIAGSSSGAGSVIQHVIALGGATSPPLFRAAITKSSYLPPQYNYDDVIPETIYSEFIAQTGCSIVSNPIECLRIMDVRILQNANLNLENSNFYGTAIFVPVVDGLFINERPTLAFRAHKLNGQMLLSIIDEHEGDMFIDPRTNDIHFFVAQLFPTLGLNDINAVIAQYSGLGSTVDQVKAIMGDGEHHNQFAIFKCPTYYVQSAFQGKGFKGAFAIPPALHDYGLPYYFPSIGIGALRITFPNKDFIDAFGQTVTNFVLALDPNIKADPNITPSWNRWNGMVEMLFNKTEDDLPVIKEILTSPALLKRCEFWESASAIIGQ